MKKLILLVLVACGGEPNAPNYDEFDRVTLQRYRRDAGADWYVPPPPPNVSPSN